MRARSRQRWGIDKGVAFAIPRFVGWVELRSTRPTFLRRPTAVQRPAGSTGTPHAAHTHLAACMPLGLARRKDVRRDIVASLLLPLLTPCKTH